jgi:hypothetical protein
MSFIDRWGWVPGSTVITIYPRRKSAKRKIVSLTGLVQKRGIYFELNAPLRVGDYLEWTGKDREHRRECILEIMIVDWPGLAPSIKHAYARFATRS